MNQSFEFASNQLIKYKIKDEEMSEEDDDHHSQQPTDQEIIVADSHFTDYTTSIVTKDNFGSSAQVSIPQTVRTYSKLPNTSSSSKVVLSEDVVKLLRQTSANSSGNNTKVVVKVLKCAHCPKIFLDQISLDKHKQTDHSLAIPEKSGDEWSRGPETTAQYKSRRIEHVISGPKKAGRCGSPQPTESTPSQLIKITVNQQEEERSIKSPITLNKKGMRVDLQLQEAIINMRDYFKNKNPLWKQTQIIREISLATKVNSLCVQRIIYHFNRHGELKIPKTTWYKTPKYQCTEEDRLQLEMCIDKLKRESRLNSTADVYREMTSSDEFNISFKGCTLASFHRIFKDTGFRITETMIVNKKPGDAHNQVSKDSKVDGHWHCSWPECNKKFKNKEHLIDHTRTHTREKPYGCVQPGCDYWCASYANFIKHLKVHKITVTKSITVWRKKGDCLGSGAF